MTPMNERKEIRSKQRDPNPKDNHLQTLTLRTTTRKETATYQGYNPNPKDNHKKGNRYISGIPFYVCKNVFFLLNNILLGLGPLCLLLFTALLFSNVPHPSMSASSQKLRPISLLILLYYLYIFAFYSFHFSISFSFLRFILPLFATQEMRFPQFRRRADEAREHPSY